MSQRMQKTLKLLLKYGFLYCVGGSTYYGIEILWRGYSHWTMFCLAGMCFIFAGLLNEIESWETPLWRQILQALGFTLTGEFLCGCVVNLWLGWGVWDYSNVTFNLLGQICLPYALLWTPLILVAIVLDDYLRYWFFGEEKPRYKLI